MKLSPNISGKALIRNIETDAKGKERSTRLLKNLQLKNLTEITNERYYITETRNRGGFFKGTSEHEPILRN